MDFLTVGDLRRAIKDVPDTILVTIENDDADTLLLLTDEVAAAKDLQDNLTMLTLSFFRDSDGEPMDVPPEEDKDEPDD